MSRLLFFWLPEGIMRRVRRQRKVNFIQNVGFAAIVAVVFAGLILWHWSDLIFNAVLGALVALWVVVTFFPERWKVPWFWLALLINAFVIASTAWLTFFVLFANYHPARARDWKLILLGYVVVASLFNFLVQGAFRRIFKNEIVTSQWRKSESNY